MGSLFYHVLVPTDLKWPPLLFIFLLFIFFNLGDVGRNRSMGEIKIGKVQTVADLTPYFTGLLSVLKTCRE